MIKDLKKLQCIFSYEVICSKVRRLLFLNNKLIKIWKDSSIFVTGLLSALMQRFKIPKK